MLFEKTFLDNADLQKFEMYRVLKTIDNYGFTINDLSVKMHVSYQQAYNIFREMLTDIEQLTGKNTRLSKKRVMSHDSFPSSVDDYRLFLLEQSVQFQFVDYLVQATSLSVDKFCQDRFISRSTLTRKTVPLRQMLAKYGIQISFTKPGFVGDERKIRYFLFAFYWLGFHGVRWPIAAIQPQQLNSAYRNLADDPRSPLVGLQEMLFWGICRLRIVRGHVLEPWARYDELYGAAPAMNTNVYSQKMFPKLTPMQRQAESQFFRFYQHNHYLFTRVQNNWLETYANVMNHDNVVHHYIDRLTDYLEQFWRKDAQLAMSDNSLLVTNMIRVAAGFYLFDGGFPQIIDFTDENRVTYPHSNIYLWLIQFHEQLPDTAEYAVFKDNAIDMTMIYCYLLGPQAKMFTPSQTVNCKIMLDEVNLNVHHVTTFLQCMSFARVMHPDEPLTSADLILTCVDDIPQVAEQVKDGQTLVTWYNDATASDFYQLYLTIKGITFRKLGLPETYDAIRI
ncbi:helix-turn-helix domain-containing protein [Lacticaseibacillus zhaodongensis]|uniref:helix-turn-helix domain-containing protein n=1 Tax=Lacticaseibacillus zhaodongensis TaxID=2668065 RepID=UPI0012D2AFEB|nr:helix-turn-helix domain-containing protein [Lacticaseibacillus zhaodongensis]